jgi:hypothetical protein
MERINFAWLVVWFLRPNWLRRKLEVCDFRQALGEAAAPGGGECGPCPNFSSYTLVFALQLRKNRGQPSVTLTERRSADRRRT